MTIPGGTARGNTTDDSIGDVIRATRGVPENRIFKGPEIVLTPMCRAPYKRVTGAGFTGHLLDGGG